MRLLQEDEDSQSNSRAVQPETSVDCSTSVQVTEAPILPAVPSSPRKTELPAEHTGGNGQSGHVQDVPPPLPQNLPRAPSDDIRPSPVISNLDAPEPRRVDPRGAHNNHSREPHDTRYLHGDLRTHRDSSPALPDDDYHPSDAPRGAYMYHEDLGRHAYARRPRPGGEYPYHREYLYHGDRGETYPGYAYAPHHENSGYCDASGNRRSYYRDTRYADRELLDDRSRGPPPSDIRGEHMHPAGREGQVGYQRAYQREAWTDGHRGSRSPIANAVPGSSEGGAIPR